MGVPSNNYKAEGWMERCELAIDANKIMLFMYNII